MAAAKNEGVHTAEKIDLTRQILTLQQEKELAVTAEVGKMATVQAEGRAAAFRDGMAYMKELFKEVRQIA